MLRKSSLAALLSIALFAHSPGAEEAQFPVIFYAVSDTDKAFEDVKAWGATHVHTYTAGLSVEKDQGFFDRAAKHGLKVMANLNGKVRVQEKVGVEALRSYASHFKQHPAMGFWYLYDEPTNTHKAEEVQPLYDALKKETPDLPVAIALNWTENWAAYRSIQDIVLNDFYPVTGAPFPRASLHTLTNFTHQTLNEYNSVIPVLQIINWRVFAEKGAKELRGYPLEALRYPTREEMRYMCFSSIAMGAKGLSFFSYDRSLEVNPRWAAEALPPVLKEVREFTQAVGSNRVQRIVRAEDDETCVGVWENNGERWVLLANSWPAPRKIIRSLRPFVQEGGLEPWGATRTATASLENGVLSVEVEPWEILIWRISPPRS